MAPLIVYFELTHTGILRPLQKRNSLSCCSMLTQGGGSGIKREGDPPPGGEGGTLGLFGWGCAAGTLQPLAYTRANSS